MFFYASKLLYFLVQPSNLAFLALVTGWLWTRAWPDSKTGRRLFIAALTAIALCGVLPLGNLILVPLEERFGERVPPIPQEKIAGIILLGGFEDGWVTGGRGGLGVNESAERLIETVRLARRLPDTKVVFTGGVGNIVYGDEAASAVRRYLIDVGIDEARIVIEDKSRTTYENAMFLRPKLKPRPGERWLLVTSAFHMPRSVGTFRAAGFEVAAYPVDFRTRGRGDLLRLFSGIGYGLDRIDLATKEWIGLIGYRLTGRSDAFFPAP